MKGLAIMLMVLILVAPLSGCFESSSDGSNELPHSNANVILLDTSTKGGFNTQYGFYTTVNITVKNTGTDSAFNVRIYLYVENQDGKKEFDNTLHMVGELPPGKTASRSVIVDSWQHDVLLKANIKTMWDGGSHNYNVDWTIGG